MLLLLHKFITAIFGRHPSPSIKEASIDQLIDQLSELRPLPVGMQEFEVWSDRIISGAMLPATTESQKFALASILLGVGQTKDHESDGYFIKCLRKGATDQIAVAKMEEIKAARKAAQDAQLEKNQPVSLKKLEVVQGKQP